VKDRRELDFDAEGSVGRGEGVLGPNSLTECPQSSGSCLNRWMPACTMCVVRFDLKLVQRDGAGAALRHGVRVVDIPMLFATIDWRSVCCNRSHVTAQAGREAIVRPQQIRCGGNRPNQ
jgi:hypothetical protein